MARPAPLPGRRGAGVSGPARGSARDMARVGGWGVWAGLWGSDGAGTGGRATHLATHTTHSVTPRPVAVGTAVVRIASSWPAAAAERLYNHHARDAYVTACRRPSPESGRDRELRPGGARPSGPKTVNAERTIASCGRRVKVGARAGGRSCEPRRLRWRMRAGDGAPTSGNGIVRGCMVGAQARARSWARGRRGRSVRPGPPRRAVRPRGGNGPGTRQSLQPGRTDARIENGIHMYDE